jgi:hypothetical protein
MVSGWQTPAKAVAGIISHDVFQFSFFAMFVSRKSILHLPHGTKMQTVVHWESILFDPTRTCSNQQYDEYHMPV